MTVFWRVVPWACLASALLFSEAGCKNYGSPDTTNAASSEAAPPGQTDPGDPANANLAPVSNSTDNTGAPQGAYANSPQEARQYQTYSNYQDPYANQQSSSTDYDDYAENETPSEYAPDPPPPMPEYQQPPCPGDGYIWAPGYWSYGGGEGYYWVPGAWVMAPYAGALWTPGWWGYTNERYGWHRGYWGRHIGYYGGVAYGHGYDGFGYQGGYWRGSHFEVNRYDNNVNTRDVHDAYNYRVKRYNTSRVSYNGGQGGLQARPRPEEVEALHERHSPPMTAQMRVAQEARSTKQNYFRANRGRPQMPAANQPLEADHNVPAPQPVRYTPPASRLGNPPWQAGARPPELPYHDVGPERMVPPMQNPHAPVARRGPVRAQGNPQEQSRPPEQRPQPQRQQARPEPQRPQQRPQQERPRGPR